MACFQRYLTLVLALCLALPAQTVFAWSKGGHKVVAFVAWMQLDADTRAKAIELIRQHERLDEDFIDKMPASVASGTQELKDQWIFLQAAAWPDVARSVPDFHHGNWHFINFAHFVRPEDEEALDLSHINMEHELPDTFDEDDINILQAMLLNKNILKNASSTQQQKAIHLCWLMHLVGDIHQPNHSTALFTSGVFSDADGDRGGNQIKVGGSSVHTIWDNLLGNSTTVGNIGSKAQEAVDAFGHLGPRAARCLDGLHWAEESHELAIEMVYTNEIVEAVLDGDDGGGDTITVSLSDEYKTNAGEVAQARAVEAGFRLAKLIEAALGE